MADILGLIGLQLFWASFALTGAALAITLYHKAAWAGNYRPFFLYLKDTHPFVALLLALAIGMVSFGVVVIPAYIFGLPFYVLTATYILALLAAIAGLVRFQRHWLPIVRQQLRRLAANYPVLLAVVALLLGADYLLSLWVGAPLTPGSDAPVHIAKSVLLASGDFTLADAFFGDNGVIETRYHVNLMLTFNALSAQITGLAPIVSWDYSLAFWRLMAWLGLFATAWTFLSPAVRWRWSYYVMALAVIVHSYRFFYADYPNKIVLVWFVLFIIGLKRFFEKRDPVVLLLAAGLIALTHPSYAVIAGGFLAVFVVAAFVFRQIKKHQLPTLAITGLMLALPVLFSFMFPNRMTELTFLDSPNDIQAIGPFNILALPGLSFSFIGWVLLIGSFVGYAYLFMKATGKLQKILVATLVVYFALIAYNPLLLHIVEGKVPLWLLGRFQEFNRLALIASFIGILAVVLYATRKLHRPLYRRGAEAAAVIAVAGLCLYQVGLFADMREVYRQTHTDVDNLSMLQDEVRGERVLADQYTQYLLPAITPTSVIDIPEEHATPMSHMNLRRACADSLRTHLSGEDLRNAKVTRVVTVERHAPLAKLADESPYLSFMKQDHDYRVYKVDREKLPNNPDHTGCIIPYGN